MTMREISKDSVVPISLGLLLVLVIAVWNLSGKVSEFSSRLDGLERAVGHRWTYHMERESWIEVEKANPGFVAPKVEQIKAIFAP